MSYKTKKILSIIISLFVLFVFTTPFFVGAQCADGTTSCLDGGGASGGEGGGASGGTKINIEIKNPFAANSIQEFIKTIVNKILIPIGAVVSVVMIIFAGFLYVTAGGNAAQIKKAQDALLWAVIGAAILLGAWVISEAIQGTIDQLKK